ncbi:hypothetical protein [Collinsella tanakaei]|uniref:hypothetical protein n=1 Tax=Collinsella tanakaei TaxID=626935 RepID=UPI0015F31B5D|nr:hypothetical protein [Collinsella tanakaei]
MKRFKILLPALFEAILIVAWYQIFLFPRYSGKKKGIFGEWLVCGPKRQAKGSCRA